MATVYLNIGMSFDPMGESYEILPEEQIIPQTHEYLFHFLDADLSRLEAYAKNYLSCLDSVEEADKTVLQRIREELVALHPFFRFCPANVTDIINRTLASYIVGHFPGDSERQKTAMARVFDTKNLLLPDVADWLEDARSSESEWIFADLKTLQERIRQWVFLALDNTNPDLARLTGAQRNALYCLVYGDDYTPLLDLTVQKNMQLPYSARAMRIGMDFDEDHRQEILQGCGKMQKDPAVTPDCIMELIREAEKMAEGCEMHTYIVRSLEDLLKYEVYNMTQAEKRIKRCKNCGRYFVIDKGNVEYCDRIATGETKPCSEIGKSRTYEQKIAKGGTAMALYRKAYKTHFARIRSGTMTKEQFEIWKGEATVKRLFVESGDMSMDEYAVWLKK